MAAIRIWKGVKRFVRGNDLSNYSYVEFEGERLGCAWEEYDARGVETKFFRTDDGRVVVHVVRWSAWENEATYGDVYIFPSLEVASASFRWEMEQAGVIERRTLTLDEVDGQ